MDTNVIVELVSNLGFPIAVCAVLMWYIVRIESKHKEETDKLSETISEHTKVLTELCTMIKNLTK
jgi:hypothetical protein